MRVAHRWWHRYWTPRPEPKQPARLAAPCLCNMADDVCPFRGPTGKPQCEDFG